MSLPSIGRTATASIALAAIVTLVACDGSTEPEVDPPRILTADLPDGVVGRPYSEGVQVTGGGGEYAWTLVEGAPPPGLGLSIDDLTRDELFIVGTPEVAGSFSFEVVVEGARGRTDSALLDIMVEAAPDPFLIETLRLPPALVGGSYRVTLETAGGGEEAPTWSVVGGDLPEGLELGPEGRFQGTPQASGTFEIVIEASGPDGTARHPFTLVVVEPEPARFDITPFPVVEIPPGLEANVAEAIRRWEDVIRGNLPPASMPVGNEGFGDRECGGFGRLANGTSIDDMLLLVNIDSIDGPLQVLGRAGPCAVRDSSLIPAVAILTLDEVDLERFDSAETVTDIIQHEIGHALGIGSLWSTFDLLAEPTPNDPRYTGEEAVAEYQEAGGAAATIPAENEGGAGTRESHWRESVFDAELMTGFAEPDGVDMYVSAMTIAALADLGYRVDLSAAEEEPLLTPPAAEHPAAADRSAGYDVVGVGPILVLGDDGVLRRIPAQMDSAGGPGTRP